MWRGIHILDPEILTKAGTNYMNAEMQSDSELSSSMYEFRNALYDRGVIFCYSGYVTEPVLSGIGGALKQKLLLEDADTNTMRNVFAIFVEQMQNIVRYSAEWEGRGSEGDRTEIRYGVLAIGMEDSKFFVSCGNKILVKDVERLKSRLSVLQTMDKNSIKTLYKEKLRGPTEETSKGAGLGFIEIARRSTEIIDFSFMELDEKFAFFALKAYV